MRNTIRTLASVGLIVLGLTTAIPSAQANPGPQLATTATALVATDFTSIFQAQQPSMTDSGWTTCGVITWSADTRGLNARQAKTQVNTLTRAFTLWGRASGLTFQRVDGIPVAYDDAAYRTAPLKSEDARARHIYIGFVTDAASRTITATNPGFAGPGAVSTATRAIDGGYAFFSIDYVTALKGRSATAKALNLYLHELGHVLGLGHASLTTNVMHPIVTSQKSLGAGDVAGIRTLTKPCTA